MTEREQVENLTRRKYVLLMKDLIKLQRSFKEVHSQRWLKDFWQEYLGSFRRLLLLDIRREFPFADVQVCCNLSLNNPSKILNDDFKVLVTINNKVYAVERRCKSVTKEQVKLFYKRCWL